MRATVPVDLLITIDFDAESAAMQRGSRLLRGPSYQSHGVFGAKVGIWRLFDLLSARSIPATFFVPGWVAERWSAPVKEISRQGHETALHGYLHEAATGMVSIAEERLVLGHASDVLSAVCGIAPIGYRPPGCLYSEFTIEILQELGYSYGSAMQDDDGPYIHESRVTPFVEIPCHWQLCDDLFGWHSDVRMTPRQVEEHWVSELTELGRYEDRLYVLTLHPHQIGHPGRLAMLERVLDLATSLGVNYRTCREVVGRVLGVPLGGS